MREHEAPNLVVCGIDFHEDFLKISLSFRIHPHDFQTFKEGPGVQQLESSEFVSQIRLPEQEHQRNPIIKRLFDRFLTHLMVCRYIVINRLAIRDEQLVLGVLVFPAHHPWPHQI